MGKLLRKCSVIHCFTRLGNPWKINKYLIWYRLINVVKNAYLYKFVICLNNVHFGSSRLNLIRFTEGW